MHHMHMDMVKVEVREEQGIMMQIKMTWIIDDFRLSDQVKFTDFKDNIILLDYIIKPTLYLIHPT